MQRLLLTFRRLQQFCRWMVEEQKDTLRLKRDMLLIVIVMFWRLQTRVINVLIICALYGQMATSAEVYQRVTKTTT